ncbi:hypothetical protein CMUS01_06396 [Colletotrichum musicola]|uniref:Uncharacterized protein n=1 Tax=Colletotrichum musicola TaxID=2175873 RepID=A0A8H6KN95_9PEZI|nr:hypothetical protein CMUS01_06396 [Colletotrichum musicola]
MRQRQTRQYQIHHGPTPPTQAGQTPTPQSNLPPASSTPASLTGSQQSADPSQPSGSVPAPSGSVTPPTQQPSQAGTPSQPSVPSGSAASQTNSPNTQTPESAASPAPGTPTAASAVTGPSASDAASGTPAPGSEQGTSGFVALLAATESEASDAPSASAVPSRSGDPSAPTASADPTASLNPSVNHSTPTDPSAPTNPTAPTAPTNPTDPTAPNPSATNPAATNTPASESRPADSESAPATQPPSATENASNSAEATDSRASESAASATQTEPSQSATESATSATDSSATQSSTDSATQASALSSETATPNPADPVPTAFPQAPPQDDTQSFTVKQALVGNFVPVIASRSFLFTLSAVYTHISALEPIRQLMTTTGASGAALSGSSISLAPIAAAFFIADVGSAISVEAVSPDAWYCGAPVTEDNLLPCPPRLSVNKWAINTVIASLALVALALLFILGLWFKTPSRITADTTTIFGVAAVMGHPEVESDFRGVPTDMTQTQLAVYLRDKRFALGAFQVSNVEKIGLVPVAPDASGGRKSFSQRIEAVLAEKKAAYAGAAPWVRTRFQLDVLFAVFHLALLGLAIAALASVDSPRRVFGYVSRSQAVGVRIGICLVGILIVRYWGMVFADAQNFAPYARMHATPSPARNTILKKGFGAPALAVVPLARMGYAIPAALALTAFLAEFFVVVISGLPWRPGQLRGEYLFCAVAAVVMTSCMLLAQGFVVYWRSNLPHLPRRPDSVASVMTYVAGTEMGRNFDSVAGMGDQTARKSIKELGRRYAYGLRVEDDGRRRWVVDEVGDGYEGSRERIAQDAT